MASRPTSKHPIKEQPTRSRRRPYQADHSQVHLLPLSLTRRPGPTTIIDEGSVTGAEADHQYADVWHAVSGSAKRTPEQQATPSAQCANEYQAVGDYAEVDRLDTTTEGPHVTMRTVDSLVPALPQPPGLLFQSVRMEEFDFCSTCGEFFLYLWACQYCGEPMCRRPQCSSPLDSNVCANHVIC